MHKAFQYITAIAIFFMITSTTALGSQWEKIRLSNKEMFNTKCQYRATLFLHGRIQTIYFNGIQPDKLYYYWNDSDEDGYVEYDSKKEYIYRKKESDHEVITSLECQCYNNQAPEEDMVVETTGYTVIDKKQGVRDLGRIIKSDWSESE